MQDLAIYNQAKKAIAEYKTVDEVKDFRDKALAIEAYAKQANDMELEWDAARARVRAERKCGELLAQLEKGKANQYTVSAISGGGEIAKSEYTEARERAGLSNDQASDFQKLARVPEEEFERAVESPAAKPSTAHILRPKEPPPPRMDADALYLWGVLREFRSRNLFSSTLADIVCEWTDAMQKDAESIIPQLKKWVNNYGE